MHSVALLKKGCGLYLPRKLPQVLVHTSWALSGVRLAGACMQGPEAVKRTVLSAWAAYLDCPEVATHAINFAAVDWPAEQASRRARAACHSALGQQVVVVRACPAGGRQRGAATRLPAALPLSPTERSTLVVHSLPTCLPACGHRSGQHLTSRWDASIGECGRRCRTADCPRVHMQCCIADLAAPTPLCSGRGPRTLLPGPVSRRSKGTPSA